MNTPRQLIGMVFLSALVACGGGKPPAPEPEPAPELEPEPEVAVEISPEAITLQQGASATFTASVTGTVNHAVVWSVAGIGGGSIDGAGGYTAPTSPGVYTVVATSVADPSKSATATVTVPVASGLGYVDPPEGGWRLVRSSLSTSSRLVLDLEGPAGEAGYGVDATLSVSSPRARWAKVSDSDTEHVVNRAFALGSGPLLFKGLPKDELLLLGVFQKGANTEATPYEGALVSIALAFEVDASVASGAAIPLAVVKAHALDAAGTLAPIEIAVGLVVAK